MAPKKIDPLCKVDGEIYEDYDCMLNQNNIGQFYIIQVILSDSQYYCWTRWGRVGTKGRKKLSELPNAESAIKMFETTFKDQTKNNWSDRGNFQSHPGKYTLIEVDGDEDAEVKEKMPLGNLSKMQILKGIAVLNEIKEALNRGARGLEELSSKFYTTIPHNFGRDKPTTIDTMEILEEKEKEMLQMLADIEVARARDREGPGGDGGN
ncbi:protein mono-ADP-ribosyltransferase PARP3-like [Osmerus mordax]|uniref:protein mono-ADP-ribosyltransferase PARP3-like n=1 Tax=Osmerus mordax TaxID=8014 RepID=UPI00351028E9